MNSNHIEIYEQFLHDSDAILDGMPLDIMTAAMKDEPSNVDPFLMALDADDIDDEIRTYASGGNMLSLTIRQRWCLAVRMMFAAGILAPFRKRHSGKENSFLKALSCKSRANLIEFLLIDMMPSVKEIISAYTEFGNEYRAPMRLPWNQKLFRGVSHDTQGEKVDD